VTIYEIMQNNAVKKKKPCCVTQWNDDALPKQSAWGNHDLVKLARPYQGDQSLVDDGFALLRRNILAASLLFKSNIRISPPWLTQQRTRIS
jgi:hypothetical protein